jgi:hypothetical protein
VVSKPGYFRYASPCEVWKSEEGSRIAREPKDGGVLVEDASSSDMALSTTSNTTLKNDKTTDAERKKERRARREAKRKAKA